jgi:hypothetical protein
MNACLPATTETVSSPLVSLASRVGSKFRPHAMVHGLSCHRRGVEIRDAGPSLVRARVRSQRVHEVVLRAEGGQLMIACSCPARSLDVVGCQHAWAALLEVDKRGGLEALRTTRGPIEIVAAGLAPERETTKKTQKTKAPATPEVTRASRRSPRATAAPPTPPRKPQKRRR